MAKTICIHSNRKDRCKECKKLGIGGSAICDHNIDKYTCRKCDGRSFCFHQRKKQYCPICKPLGSYSLYIKNDKRKGNVSSDFMSYEEFQYLVEQNCWFCNRSPQQVNGMGIDRIDNEKGHISGNVRPCCYTCNRMRMDLTNEEFLYMCKRISEYRLNADNS